MARRGGFWVIGLVWTAWPAVAGARVEVLVTPADANCISSPELDSRIVEWLEQRGATPIDRDKLAESRASVQVTAHDGDGWTAIVEVETPGQPGIARREITTSDRACRDLDAALVVVLGTAAGGTGRRVCS